MIKKIRLRALKTSQMNASKRKTSKMQASAKHRKKCKTTRAGKGMVGRDLFMESEPFPLMVIDNLDSF